MSAAGCNSKPVPGRRPRIESMSIYLGQGRLCHKSRARDFCCCQLAPADGSNSAEVENTLVLRSPPYTYSTTPLDLKLLMNVCSDHALRRIGDASIQHRYNPDDASACASAVARAWEGIQPWRGRGNGIQPWRGRGNESSRGEGVAGNPAVARVWKGIQPWRGRGRESSRGEGVGANPAVARGPLQPLTR